VVNWGKNSAHPRGHEPTDVNGLVASQVWFE
jgi:hypothetical protein